MGVGAPDDRPSRSIGFVVVGSTLAMIGIVVLVLAFLGVVGAGWAGIALTALIVALALVAVRRATLLERRVSGRDLD